MISAERIRSVRTAPAISVLLGLGPTSRTTGASWVVVVRPDPCARTLCDALVGEEGAAEHQDRPCSRPRQRTAPRSRAAGRMISSLLRIEPIAILFTIGSSRSAARPWTILRGHRGVVDDHAGGLGGRLAGGGADVARHGGRGQLGDRQRTYVVEESKEAGAHVREGYRAAGTGSAASSCSRTTTARSTASRSRSLGRGRRGRRRARAPAARAAPPGPARPTRPKAGGGEEAPARGARRTRSGRPAYSMPFTAKPWNR